MKNLNISFRPLFMAFAFVMVASAAFAQSRESINVSSFDELKVSNAFVVEISVGSKESLEIEIEDRYRDDLIAEVRNGALVIGLDNSSRNRRMRESPRAYVTVKSLNRINISGAVTLKTLDVLETDRMNIDMSGASVIRMEVEVDDLYLEASGACVITMEGLAENQFVKSSGATTYSAYDLESKTADIRVNGAGSAKVSVSDELEVRASGASSVKYRGNPRVSKSTSGASSVRKG